MLVPVLSLAHAAPFTPAGPSAPGVADLSGAGDGPTSQIINGEASTAADWPMTGGLIVSGTAVVSGFGEVDGRGLMCSSTLIAPDVVLTAAHCVDVEGLIDAAASQGVTIESYENLQMGWSRQELLYEWSLEDSAINGVKDWPSDVALSSNFVAKPQFDLFTLQVGLAANHDIALVFLDEPVLDVPFAIVPTAEEGAQLAVGDPVVVVGWGQQEQDPLPGTLGIKQQGTSVISELANPEFHVGAAFEDVRKCHGDSGGPSFKQVETTSSETWRVVGVTSHAYDATTDCRVTGGVDTRVDAHLEWLDQTMRDACADGTRSWCEWPGLIPPPDEDGNFVWELSDGTADDGDGGGEGCGCDSGSGAVGVPGVLVLSVLLLRRRSTRS
jgi:hypothetical protein